eukprot:TRINITY_DN511_c0_g1_i1.p1 TRINITY_DN511_c0_g1~~TRINITY_DN511_c0_g1_i1.p1  ORF type:complete len:344 (-),score=103.06 TRINITY_DN511_c0_g1_i1:73-1104(-)
MSDNNTAVTSTKRNVPNLVVVHPLVLLSVVDHYNRVSKETKKRVVGVLLGEVNKGVVDVTNSYAVPFEEDTRGAKPIWFVDHNYHENMYGMFKKVNAKEAVVGWYSTGPTIRPADLDIHALWKRYTPNPILVIVDVEPTEIAIPTKAYATVEEVSKDGTRSVMSFQHIPSEVGAVEAEEVGVEHLLRDIHDTSISTVASNVNAKLLSLKSLVARLKEVHDYLGKVVAEELPVNHVIITQLQDVFNLLPNIAVDELVKSFAVKTNDMMLVIYLSSLIRSIIALHNLLNNKQALRKAEKGVLEKAAEEDAAKEREERKKREEAILKKEEERRKKQEQEDEEDAQM